MKKKIKIIPFIVFILLIFFAAYKVIRRISYNEFITRIHYIPPFIYSIEKEDTVNKGYFIISPYKINHWRHGHLIVMDRKGNIIFQKYLNTSAFCFRQWKINGKTFYTYIVNDHIVFHINDIKLAAGNVIIVDSALNEIGKIHLKPFRDITVTKNEDLDLHDFLLLGENHYITMAVLQKKIKNPPSGIKYDKNKKVAIALIQEIKNDVVIWQWNSLDFPELLSASVENNDYIDTSKTADYLHINACTLDPHDSNLLLSFKNTNQILKVSRKTGEILWRLGGKNSDFPLTKERFFLRQHAPTFVDSNNTLLILDNGDSATRQYSRVLEFRLDEKNKKVLAFKAFTIPEPYVRYMGNVQKFGDNYVIAGGSANFILDINYKTGIKNFELKDNLAIYRTYRVEDINGILNLIKSK